MDISEQLQLNIRVYANATNISVSFIDKDGFLKEQYGTPCSYCSLFREATGKYCPCDSNHAKSCEQARTLGDSYISLCPAGLIHFAVAIMRNGSYQGSVIAGPIMLDYPDISAVDEVIQKFGIDLSYRRKLYTALSGVPLIDPFQSRHLSKLLYLLISNLFSGENDRLEATRQKAMQQAHIGDFIRLAKENDTQSPSQYEAEKKLVNYVISGDAENAKKLLNEMLGQIYFTSGNNIEIIKVRTIELVSTLSHAMYEAGMDDKTVYDMTDSFMRALPEKRDLTELSYHLLETLELFSNMTFPAHTGSALLVRKAIAYMNEYYNQNPSLSDVASYVGLNPNYFSSLFKKETGKNFSSYLLKIRLDNAKLLLKNTNLTLSEIAAELGFDSQSYFSRLFKKETGLTPREYRHQL